MQIPRWYLSLALASSAEVKREWCHTLTPPLFLHSVDLNNYTFYLGSGHDVFLTRLFECVIRHSSNRSTVYSIISGYQRYRMCGRNCTDMIELFLAPG
jgi:hypothetical protein